MRSELPCRILEAVAMRSTSLLNNPFHVGGRDRLSNRQSSTYLETPTSRNDSQAGLKRELEALGLYNIGTI